eukprot:5804554-Lingulodinium_polyedra.AAC.1
MSTVVCELCLRSCYRYGRHMVVVMLTPAQHDVCLPGRPTSQAVLSSLLECCVLDKTDGAAYADAQLDAQFSKHRVHM